MRSSRSGSQAVVVSFALIALAIGIVLWIDASTPTGLTVHVRVVEAATGAPVGNVKVRGRYDETWVGVDQEGRVRLVDVQLPPGVRASSETLSRLIEVNGRFAVAAPTPARPVVRGRDEWEVEVPVESFGLLTVSLKATVLPNVRAYLETSDAVRAVPEEGRGVARLGEAATYRVFPGPRRVPVVLKGDTGVAMARWLVRTPGPGAHLQRSYGAIPATPFAGRVVLGAGESPPSLGGRLAIEPHGWRARAAGDALEVLGPLDPVVVRPDGTFLAPHTSAGAFDLTLELDFLGRFTWPTPTEIRPNAEDTLLDVDSRTAWVRLALPAGMREARQRAAWEITADDGDGARAWLVHDRAATYAVLPGTGSFTVRVALPGSEAHPPRAGEARLTIDAPGPAEAQIEAQDAPFGTLEVVVPDAVRTTMRGATVTLDSGRTWSLLANLTERIALKHVRAGPQTVKVVWRDEAYAPFIQAIDVPAGGTATVTVERRASVR